MVYGEIQPTVEFLSSLVGDQTGGESWQGKRYTID